jgi:hypothetical protein
MEYLYIFLLIPDKGLEQQGLKLREINRILAHDASHAKAST